MDLPVAAIRPEWWFLFWAVVIAVLLTILINEEDKGDKK